jgi:hypothetical protein
MKRCVALPIVLLLLVVSACGDSREDDVRWGVQYAKRVLTRAATDPLAAAALGSAEETGGDAVSYIYGGLADGARCTSFDRDRPRGSWTVVLRAGPGQREWTIEGYGEDLAKPLLTERVDLARP